MQRDELLKEMTRTIEELRAFNEIGKTLTSTLNIGEVLSIIMEKISQLLRPTNWSLLLVDEDAKELYFEIVVGEGAEKLKDVRLPLNEGVVGWVTTNAQPILVTDATKDERWCDKMDDMTQFQTRSILCAPMVVRDSVLGVIELSIPSRMPFRKPICGWSIRWPTSLPSPSTTRATSKGFKT